jgi:ribonuclease-3
MQAEVIHGMDKSRIKALQKRIHYKFKKTELLVLALTHPSFVQGTTCSQHHNQRLEFLGDAILNMIVAEELFRSHPDEREGFLTKARSGICHGKALTQVARDLGLDAFMLLGKGEQKAKIHDSSLLLGDCLEAILGAIYLDGGIKAAHKAVLQWMKEAIHSLPQQIDHINHKGALQEWAQSRPDNLRFSYELVGTEGPDHAKRFSIAVKANGLTYASANASSKRDAEADAARLVLEMIQKHGGKLPDHPDLPAAP